MILTCDGAVLSPAVTPPPGTSRAGSSTSDTRRLLLSTNSYPERKENRFVTVTDPTDTTTDATIPIQ